MTTPPRAQKMVCFAPMLKVTTPHYLYLLSLMSKHLHLYSEMIVARAVLDPKNHERVFVSKHISNHLALQLAGNNPEELQAAVKIVNRHASYNEINLNVGCPSKRADAGTFGVCLMEKPNMVATAMRAMKDSTASQVSLKCRIGINDQNNGDLLRRLIDTLLKFNACDKLILHARPAIMKLKPKQNWSIPALNYPLAFRIREEYKELPFVLNGGIGSLDAAVPLLQNCDGVMIGRAFETTPALTLFVDDFCENKVSQKTNAVLHKQKIIHQYLDYCTQYTLNNPAVHPHYLFIPLMHCFHQQVFARKWRVAIGKIIQTRPPHNVLGAIDKIRLVLDTVSSANDNEDLHHLSKPTFTAARY